MPVKVSAALQKVLTYLDIALLDHLIIGANTVLSLSQAGLFERVSLHDED